MEVLKNYGERMKYLTNKQVEKINKLIESKKEILADIDKVSETAGGMY